MQKESEPLCERLAFCLLFPLLGGRGGRLGGVLGLLLFLQNAVGDLADERLGQ